MLFLYITHCIIFLYYPCIISVYYPLSNFLILPPIVFPYIAPYVYNTHCVIFLYYPYVIFVYHRSLLFLYITPCIISDLIYWGSYRTEHVRSMWRQAYIRIYILCFYFCLLLSLEISLWLETCGICPLWLGHFDIGF